MSPIRACAWACLALLVSTVPLLAQEAEPGWVWGAVYSAADSSPLIGAQIYIPALKLGTSSDARGRFVIMGVPEGEWALRVERACYVPADLEIATTSEGLQIDSVLLTPTAQFRAGGLGSCLPIGPPGGVLDVG